MERKPLSHIEQNTVPPTSPAGQSVDGVVDDAAHLRNFGAGINPHHPWRILHEGYTVLVSRPDGCLTGIEREGLYDFDTRILSRHRILLNGETPLFVSGGSPDAHRWRGHLYQPREGGDAGGPALPQDALELQIERRVGRGMTERLVLRNHSMTPAETELTLELDADFADLQEVGGERRQQGRLEVDWDATTSTLLFDYQVSAGDHALHRALRVRVQADGDAAHDGRSLRFTVRLAARASWCADITFASLVDGEWREPAELDALDERDRARARWRAERTSVASPDGVAEAIFERAAEDLLALRLWEQDAGDDAWIPIAGVPTYTGFFGRDSLTAAWQGALIGPEMMRGALARIAATQATENSAWRDEEPGKMVHEMRRGPLAELNLIPQRAYYGTQTSSAMFPVILSEYWHWTGDDEALRRYRDAALRTFEWAEHFGDRDGDGFLEYVKRSPKGLKNHAWKDSDEAIRYPDGTLVENPIATVEEQAYHFLALERMGEVLLALDEEQRAEGFLSRARELKTRWHDAFWMEDAGFYAMALDGAKRPVRSIGSNAGHALATGMVPPEFARRVADRLLAPDLFSGWGVRTLSADHPAYNPFGYHLGTVWPVENATFALGFKRYGLDEHTECLFSALYDAAAQFSGRRLPEALGGHARDAVPIPTVYPTSNSPQAWSASATLQLLQAILGIYPFAPARLLALVRPRLPPWLPELTLRNLRVGDATVSLRFHRNADGSADHEVLERQGTLVIVGSPPPQAPDETRSWGERLKEWSVEHAPGRTARALRIALGHSDAPRAANGGRAETP